MSRYFLELATGDCDAELERVARLPTPGDIELSFQHEPSFLAAGCVLGHERQTIIGRDRATGEVIGLGTRAVREVYIDGEPQRIGYLGALRMVPARRNRGLLARGYQYLRQLHDEDARRPAFYLTTIADGNDVALDILTSGRAGLPQYHNLTTLHTLALPRRRIAPHRRAPPPARAFDLDEVLAFVQCHGPQRQFFPVYAASDFVSADRLFRDLSLSDIVVARRGERIVGVAGVWDQRRFRQTVITSYSRRLQIVRPLYNGWARWTTGLKLPQVGTRLPQCYVAFPIVADNDGAIFAELLAAMATKCPPDIEVLLLGLCDNDPLLPHAERRSAARYRTQVFAVCWGERPQSLEMLMKRTPYLELGCL